MKAAHAGHFGTTHRMVLSCGSQVGAFTLILASVMVGHMFEACKRDHHLKGISERTRH